MAVIKVQNITKDYGDRRGVFDVSFEINQGEVFGFLGPNGAGKTTTIRQLLGFIKPDSGTAYINGMQVWEDYYKTNANVGYIPGEINFPEKTTGTELMKWMAEMRGLTDMGKAKELLEILELKNVDSDLKKMSKGMKQKLGIVCALMHNPEILILDEPTSGLDPLMQQNFVELIRREKAAGKTILMSSHMFIEVEKTCDRIAIIKQGEIIASVNMVDIRKPKTKIFKIKFAEIGESKKVLENSPPFLEFIEISHEKNRVKVKLDDNNVNQFVLWLAKFKLQYFCEIKQTLEDYFMHFYSNKKEGGI